VSVSWYEIHNESVNDLFTPEGGEGRRGSEGRRGNEERRGGEELKIVDKGKGKGLEVDGLAVLQIASPEEAFELINK
jgi:hypothetical protein